jgi:hypothetical protein
MSSRYHHSQKAQIALYGLLIALVSLPAWAGDRSDDDAPLGSYQDQPREWITKDRRGNTTGSVREESWGAVTTDKWGNRTGYIVEQSNGDRVQYDKSGSRVGTVERR